MPPRLWIVPDNDLEAETISSLLTGAGERCLITRQPWGASWGKLEPEICSQIKAFRHDHPYCPIYGVELAGNALLGALNIDHHSYPNDNRYSSDSSLEQVAALLGIQLNRHQLLVAANDKGWIPELRAVGATPSEIDAIRRADRRKQGVSEADELNAYQDVSRAQLLNGLLMIDTPVKPNSAHTDFAVDRATQILVRSPQQWHYSGPHHRRLHALSFSEPHWSGGLDSYGFFGIESPRQATQQTILDTLLLPCRLAPPNSTNLEILLYLPFRIESFGPLKQARDNPNRSPSQWLRDCGDWITGVASGSPSPWRFASRSNLSWDDRQTDYAKFVYFHPFVHDLFPSSPASPPSNSDTLAPMLTLERSDLSELHLVLCSKANDPTVDLQRPQAMLDDPNVALSLKVEKVELHLLLTDIFILSVHLSYRGSLPVHQTMNLLNEVRRAYPSFWKPNSAWACQAPPTHCPPGQSPLLAQWVYRTPPSHPPAISEFADRRTPIQHVENTSSAPLMPHWLELLAPLTLHHPQQPPSTGLSLHQLGDDRAFLSASILLDRYSDLNPAEWMRLAFVDEGGGSWAYNQAFLNQTEAEKHHFYDRFHDQGTRYLITGYSFLQVMQKSDFSYYVLRPHLFHHYHQLCLLALFQKASILTLSHRLALLLRDYANSDRSRRHLFHHACRALANDFSIYVALYDFAEVSSQLQAVELFDMLRGHLRTNSLFQELHEQINFTVTEESKNYEEYIQALLNFAVPVTIALGLLGASYGWDKYSAWVFNDFPPPATPTAPHHLPTFPSAIFWLAFPLLAASLLALAFYRLTKWWLVRRRP